MINEAIIITFIGSDLILTFTFRFTMIVLQLGQWAATCPWPWHLWQTMLRLCEDDTAADTMEGAVVLIAGHRCSCWIVGEEAVDTDVFGAPIDEEGIAAS
jgi:hypothetical protein